MVNNLKQQKELERLRHEHSKLENELNGHVNSKVVNSFIVQALKKKRLSLKQAITQLEAILLNNIVA